jgi:ABC-type antimicrobial peptide transport system permease subunit
MFQFAASFVLICLTIAIALQIRHGQHRPLGYDKEYLLRVSGMGGISPQSPIREEVGKSALVASTAYANDPLVKFGNSGSGYQWQGKNTDFNPQIFRSNVSSGYIQTVGLKLLEGRDFYEGSEADGRSVIINKTLANMMGDEGKISCELWVGNKENAIIYTIIGITDDHICDDIYSAKSEPMLLHKEMLRGRTPPCLYVRFNANADVGNALKTVQTTLSQFPSDNPLEYAFVDELLNLIFDAQRQEGFLVALFSFLSVLISCLGLFGLVTYVAETKTKEIGIRKILGASVGNLVVMLTKEFMVLVTISACIAIPLAYYWIEQMLQHYEYRISIGGGLFATALLIMVILTLFTVGWQARKASTGNPVKALKTE